MSGLLASVRSVDEAMTARDGGADIIDCKDPDHGALGALPVDVITDIVSAVAGTRPTSATTGDAVNGPRQLHDAVCRTAACGVDYVKFGVFDIEAVRAQYEVLRGLGTEHRLIAVCFVDLFDPTPLLPALAATGIHGIMLDTAHKRGPALTALWRSRQIADVINIVQRHGLLCGLAGRLGLADIAHLLPLGADYLGFRSALCGGDRRKQIDHSALARVCCAMHETPPRTSPQRLAVSAP
ncbi:MAG: (5-formylfuran-3-yl)methyl phosphate synthase [Gammaproteobacteria bacterium]|nr:(5-formylfuran-3-yl)methyl phosphate synthase [Gammaproteobacteria bacterium]